MGTTAVIEHDAGFTWIADTDERLKRASHALRVNEKVWLIDPVEAEAVRSQLADAEVGGVVVLLDRHRRDSETFATRYDVPVSLPKALGKLETELAVETRLLGDTLGEYQIQPVVSTPVWQETLLTDGETLVVAEAVGTAPHYRLPDVPLGVHPLLRGLPPDILETVSPEQILVGHGRPVREGGTDALQTALEGARRRAPKLYASMVKDLLVGDR